MPNTGPSCRSRVAATAGAAATAAGAAANATGAAATAAGAAATAAGLAAAAAGVIATEAASSAQIDVGEMSDDRLSALLARCRNSRSKAP